MHDLWTRYGKSITAALFAGLTAAAATFTDGHITRGEGIQIAVAVVTAAGVWLAPNLPTYQGVKTILAAILAALDLAVTSLAPGHVTGAEWTNLALAAVGVIAVGVAPSISETPLAATVRPPI